MAVMECKQNCKPHAFQDKKYGKGKRVFNKTRKQDGTLYRCTVCNGEQVKK